jgi:hypothetical protein
MRGLTEWGFVVQKRFAPDGYEPPGRDIGVESTEREAGF